MIEMEALEKKITWNLVLLSEGKKLWDADECSLLSIKQMRLLKDTRHDWW